MTGGTAISSSSICAGEGLVAEVFRLIDELPPEAAQGLRHALSGLALLPKEPPAGLLVSMALRLNHGFGLCGEDSRNAQLTSMRQVYEEVTGQGFWSPENDHRYTAMTQAARRVHE